MLSGEMRDILSRLCGDRGAVGFGVCRLADIRTDDFLLPAAVLARMPLAISVAMRVSPDVLGTLEDHPNQLYEHHYRQVNFALDRLTLELANRIGELGGHALPIAASQLVDWENQRGHLSHKRVAAGAGLGWLGRNNLLATPRYGARVRLVTGSGQLRRMPPLRLNLPGTRHRRDRGRIQAPGLLCDAQVLPAPPLCQPVYLRVVRPRLFRVRRVRLVRPARLISECT
jgi:hypothetical protein